MSSATVEVKPWQEVTMPCPRCGMDIEKEKPDPKTKLFESSGTKRPYCFFCSQEEYIKQDPAGLEKQQKEQQQQKEKEGK